MWHHILDVICHNWYHPTDVTSHSWCEMTQLIPYKRWNISASTVVTSYYWCDITKLMRHLCYLRWDLSLASCLTLYTISSIQLLASSILSWPDSMNQNNTIYKGERMDTQLGYISTEVPLKGKCIHFNCHLWDISKLIVVTFLILQRNLLFHEFLTFS